MKEAIKAEPVAFQGFIVALLVALLTTARSFGVPITDEQQTAVSGLAVAILVVWLFLIRAQVTPAASVVLKDTGVGVVAGPASDLKTSTVVASVVPVLSPDAADDDAEFDDTPEDELAA